MKFAAVAAMALALSGCGEDPVSQSRTDNPAINVGLLFEHEGCRVYRFKDYGRPIYYTHCPSGASRTEWHEHTNNGKTSTTQWFGVPTSN